MRLIDADKLEKETGWLDGTCLVIPKQWIKDAAIVTNDELKNYLNANKEPMYTSDEVAKLLYELFGDFPCCFNDFDEISLEDDWCEKKCGNVIETDCWKHFLTGLTNKYI